MNERIFKDKLIFELDDDGDHYDSFESAYNYAIGIPGVNIVKYQPGFFDDSMLQFDFDGIRFTLEYSGFMGTELKCENTLPESQIEKARTIAKEFQSVISR